ncbi:MAG: hypothetical protein ACI89L_002595 [Phycisphaerales bacterium]|jgi:hypothetical protein
MSQFGMQMPGGRGRSGPTPDVFTALMFLASIAMLVACGVLYWANTKVAPTGNPFSVQQAGEIKFKD